MYKWFFPLILFSKFVLAAAEENVFLLYRGVHANSHMTLPAFSRTLIPEDTLSPAARFLSSTDRDRLIRDLVPLSAAPDTLNTPPAINLLSGVAQKFVNNYYQFQQDFQNPGSALYKALDIFRIDTADHFFISTSFSLKEAALFAAGGLYGRGRDRRWPKKKKDVVGWIEVYAIPQSHLERMLGLVINEGHAMGMMEITERRFLRPQEVLLCSYIPSRYHRGRIPLALYPAKGLKEDNKIRNISLQAVQAARQYNRFVEQIMQSNGYVRANGTVAFERMHTPLMPLTDQDSINLRTEVEGLGRSFSSLGSNPDGSITIEVGDYVGYDGFDWTVNHALNYFSRAGRELHVILKSYKFSATEDGLRWLSRLVNDSNVRSIEWDPEETPNFAQWAENEEEQRHILEEELSVSGREWAEVPYGGMVDLRAALKRRTAPLEFDIQGITYGPSFIDALEKDAGSSVDLSSMLREEAEEEQSLLDEHFRKQGYLSVGGGVLMRLLPGKKGSGHKLLVNSAGEYFNIMDASFLPSEYVEKTIEGMDSEYRSKGDEEITFPILGKPGTITTLTLSTGAKH